MSTILSLCNFGCHPLQFLTCQKLKPPPPFFLQANSMSTGSLPLPTHFACGVLYLELNGSPLLGACSQVIIRLFDSIHAQLLRHIFFCLFSLPSTLAFISFFIEYFFLLEADTFNSKEICLIAFTLGQKLVYYNL